MKQRGERCLGSDPLESKRGGGRSSNSRGGARARARADESIPPKGVWEGNGTRPPDAEKEKKSHSKISLVKCPPPRCPCRPGLPCADCHFPPLLPCVHLAALWPHCADVFDLLARCPVSPQPHPILHRPLDHTFFWICILHHPTDGSSLFGLCLVFRLLSVVYGLTPSVSPPRRKHRNAPSTQRSLIVFAIINPQDT